MNQQEQFRTGQIAGEMALEVRRARELYPGFNSRHEGYAVLLEEVTELQSEVFKKHPTLDDMRKEAIQIGAMAIRFVQDCCEVKE